MSFKIKNIHVKNKGLLAPMLEYTTLPFRKLCCKYGCGLTYTEMASINQINSVKDLSKIDLFDTVSSEKVCAQIVGDFTNLKGFSSAVEILDNYKPFKIIDLNFGCPSLKVHGMNGGAKLLSKGNFTKAVNNVKEVVSTTNKPITVKTRLGYHKENIQEIVSSFEDADVSAVAVHGRLANQNYSVASDYCLLEDVSKEKSTSFIYNGDVTNNNFNKFLEVPSFSGVMVGRAALSNPYIFKSISKGKKKELKQEKIIKDYLRLVNKYPVSFNKKKLALLLLTKSIPNSSKYRLLISRSKTDDDLKEIITSFV
jgi:tRNA-dihydrouridine synthase B